jgi:hypothetical protein
LRFIFLFTGTYMITVEKEMTKIKHSDDSLELCIEKKNRNGTRYFIDDLGNFVAKECTRCREVKRMSNFSVSKNRLGGCQPRCKACDSLSKAEWSKSNPDYGRTYYKENRSTTIERAKTYYYENKEKVLSNTKKYRIKNRETISENQKLHYVENREKYALRSKLWQKENLDKCRLINHRYRARKRLLPNTLTEEQMSNVINFFGGCALTYSKEIHWDHVVPLATGHGGTILGNMIPLRMDLNASKQESNIFEWFEANRQRFNLEQERFDRLIEWLGKANGMTVEEYRDYVYECHANPNEINDAKAN